MEPSVKSVTYRENYVLSITFDNGEVGQLDMEPYLDFGVFKKLKSKATFKTAHVSFDTIAWETGADLDPEFVYTKCLKTVTAQQSAPADARTSRS